MHLLSDYKIQLCNDVAVCVVVNGISESVTDSRLTSRGCALFKCVSVIVNVKVQTSLNCSFIICYVRTAEVPKSEMADYTIALRALSQGYGSFTFYFVRYEEAPANVAQKIIDEAKKAEA